ncbi:MAG TPA: hypothetical protein DIW36_09665 [Ruminococcaceae bacterium]|nr:hypothetical protein [Oscillospiraceae bacterium]HAY73970.1 hypothetical protein [Oscillospiraceae bacterium]HCT17610.1 hypothetical protein [Oscillospiraceae bacterium]
MQKTLEELGEEYLDSAKLIEELIRKYRKILKETYASGNYLKTYEIKRKLTIFYDQKRELVSIGKKLINYYDKEDI